MALASTFGLACASPGRSGPSLADPAGDAALAAAIEREIRGDDAIDASGLRVRVSAGVATLEGVVRSTDEARRALRHAARVGGVLQVVNRLIVVESRAGRADPTPFSRVP